jgi:FAD/FMN-containing dehydrogenase
MSTISETGIPIDQVRADLNGQVIAPDDPGYDEARASFYPMFDRRPALIVRPADAGEVAYVVGLARDNGVELAVRSGGHSMAGHSTSEGGIVLDLGAMKGIDIDPKARTAWVEAGVLAGELTDAAGEHDMAIGLGDTGSVGIGGLTLGGGVGFLVRKHGLTIDNLLAADVVTADGSVLRADHEQNPDLFWAIRGGGGNFGVVTRFHFRLQPLKTVTGGMLLLPATADVIASFVEAAAEASEDLSAIANVMVAPPMPFIPEEHRGKLVLMALIVHAGPPEEGEAAMAPFRGLATPLADMLRPMAYPEIYPKEEGEFHPLAAGRNLFVDRVDRGVAQTILDNLQASTAMMRVTQLRVLGGAMARVPADATAFAHRQSKIMVNVGAVYGSLDEESVHEEWVERAAASLRQDDTGSYVNFVGGEHDEQVHAAYPAETWERLAAVKRRYDPNNLFRVNHNIPPAG